MLHLPQLWFPPLHSTHQNTGHVGLTAGDTLTAEDAMTAEDALTAEDAMTAGDALTTLRIR